jgi:hypothetical protein
MYAKTHNDTTYTDLYFECADETIEAAAAEIKYKAGSQTISFCSGIDTCPSRPESPVLSG